MNLRFLETFGWLAKSQRSASGRKQTCDSTRWSNG